MITQIDPFAFLLYKMNRGFNRDSTEPYTNARPRREKEHYSDATEEFIRKTITKESDPHPI